MLPHFCATMDTWDPIIVNTLAQTHPLILLDFPGVSHSTGKASSTFAAIAIKVINFVSLIKVSQVDLLGFSISGCVAQIVVVNGPLGLIRKLIIASTGPTVGPDTVSRQTLPEEGKAASRNLDLK